jgi:Tfp pilus assembly protein PilO
MKSKIILLIAGAAVVTLSFTFATSSQVEKREVKTSTHEQPSDAPAGGFVLEDK